MPIGEMWNLEALAKHCRENGKYEFFFCSSPSNVSGRLIMICLRNYTDEY